MKWSLVGLVVSGLIALAGRPALAGPSLAVTADHLGGGYIQYTFNVDNDLGGNMYVQMSAVGGTGQINQIASPGLGDIDLLSMADVADAFDTDYQTGGGKDADSWWNDEAFTFLGPPFGGPQGGGVGSNLFQFSGGTLGLAVGTPNVTLLGQIVILDSAVALLPLGNLPVITTGAAQVNIVDPSADPFENSVVAADGLNFSIVGSYAVQAAKPGDFDGDGLVDSDDVDALCTNLSGSYVATYDVDNDGFLDENDLIYHVENLLEFDSNHDGQAEGSGTYRGDFNTDGAVNGTDLSILADNFDADVGFASGNANCDSIVNGTDLSILASTFGNVVTTGVPEPTTMLLLSLGGLALIRRRALKN